MGHETCMGKMINVHKILDRKPEGKRSLRKTKQTWEDNIGMDLMEIRWEGVDWIHLARNSDQ